MSQDNDSAFVYNFLKVMGILTIIAVVIFIVANTITSDGASSSLEQQAVESRTKPVGEVSVKQAAAEGDATVAKETAPEETSPAAQPASGEAIYQQACVACHGMGIAGAPKFGDAAAWAGRLEKGKETLYSHAINGFQGEVGMMPPKGGQIQLSDDEIKATVDYMIAKVGGDQAAETATTEDAAPSAESQAATTAEGTPSTGGETVSVTEEAQPVDNAQK